MAEAGLYRTKAGMKIILAGLVVTLLFFGLFCVVHWAFLYFLLVRGMDFLSQFIAWFLIFYLFAFAFSWVIILIGLIVVATEAWKYKNGVNAGWGAFMWFLIVPLYFGIGYLFVRLLGWGDNYVVQLIMFYIVLNVAWFLLAAFVPIYGMKGKELMKKCFIMLILSTPVAVILSFIPLDIMLMLTYIPVQVAYLSSLVMITLGYYGFYNWLKTIPTGTTIDELEAYKMLYWDSEGPGVPDRIIARSKDDFIALSLVPVAKESDMPEKAYKFGLSGNVLAMLFFIVTLTIDLAAEPIKIFVVILAFILGVICVVISFLSVYNTSKSFYLIRAGEFLPHDRMEMSIMLSVTCVIFFLTALLTFIFFAFL